MAKREGLEGVDAEELAVQIRQAAEESATEEDLRVRVEHILRLKALDKLDVAFGKYERATVVCGARRRPDALYGYLVIEYKAPGVLSTKQGREDAINKLRIYIEALSRERREDKRRFLGVAVDGHTIIFVRFRAGRWEERALPVNSASVAMWLQAFTGLSRRALSPDMIVEGLGPKSPVARRLIEVLYRKLVDHGRTDPRVRALFEDWKRVFSQVCAYKPEKLRGLEKEYGIKGKVNCEALLFAIHTYYALVMKLIAAEVAVLCTAPILRSFFGRLEEAYVAEGDEEKLAFREEFKRLEDGERFRQVGVVNFTEADYFAWYLHVWDRELAEAIWHLVRVLSDYEIGTVELEPGYVRDLFKRLYQRLVPKKVRHDLGEYYTPDWLAELVLDEVGFTVERLSELAREKGPETPFSLRLLDPACGSGTFLVLAIERLKEVVEENWELYAGRLDFVIKSITENVVGFDLNPLAVIAARANYLIQLGRTLLWARREPIEIPIYLADSILIERKPQLTGDVLVLSTSVGDFEVPAEVIEKEKLGRALSIMDECLHRGYTPEQLKAWLKRELRELSDNAIEGLAKLYDRFLELEREQKNRIWLRILKNSFAPLFKGRFDFVVGNPPWVNWESLPEGYRRRTRVLWAHYNLLPTGRGLGRVKKDIAMLFVYRCMDLYLREGGMFGFLITQTVFKSMAGTGFRNFTIPSMTRDKTTPFRVLKVHDMVEFKPFEGAQNRTAIIICRLGEPTEYPVPYVLWKKAVRGEIPTDASLSEVLAMTKRYELEARPLDPEVRNSPWATLTGRAYNAVRKLIGRSAYVAHAGVYCGLNAAYWVEVLCEAPDGRLLVRNVLERAKKKVRQVEWAVEPELVYPLLRGRDVARWLARPTLYIVVPTDKHGINLPENELKVRYPGVFGFFTNFKEELKSRSIYKLAGKGGPWYGLYVDIGPYTFAPYKVVWREQAAELTCALVPPVEDRYVGKKVVIPAHKLMLVPLKDEDEAHYLCALLNSSPVRLLVKSFMVETQISTHVIERVEIDRYDPGNRIHRELVQLSKRAHELVSSGQFRELEAVEKRIDELIAELYGLTRDELEDVRVCLSLLLCEDEKTDED
ncbi:MAG TPA: class I SAM-dependent DNA methyltransferase [Candidatus Bathyarchaeota archaeon]|nr:class I SAM-dependent DNA methyltransferase [Candidatus Bathyarchaeota archaeon]